MVGGDGREVGSVDGGREVGGGDGGSVVVTEGQLVAIICGNDGR